MKRRPLGAKRDLAEQYLLITIAAFATTVAATRWYLDLAGYPTIGGGELHVAHVLWGGLLLVIAVLLPMLFVGRRALLLSALLAGIGVGLFIDEVGKFLTTSNDYFYAPAAPIIYGGILLLVLLWLVIRRLSSDNVYDATHAAIEALRDGVDGSLTDQRRDRVVRQLREVDRDAAASGETIAARLLATLESPAMDASLSTPGWVASGRARDLLERVLPTRVERWLVNLSLLYATLSATVAALLLLASTQIELNDVTELIEDTGRLEFPTEPIWILLALGINVVVGLLAVAALVFLRRGRKRDGLNVALAAIVTSLVAGGLVTFYAAQSTALTSTLITVVQLGLVIDLRIRVRAADVDAPTG